MCGRGDSSAGWTPERVFSSPAGRDVTHPQAAEELRSRIARVSSSGPATTSAAPSPADALRAKIARVSSSGQPPGAATPASAAADALRAKIARVSQSGAGPSPAGGAVAPPRAGVATAFSTPVGPASTWGGQGGMYQGAFLSARIPHLSFAPIVGMETRTCAPYRPLFCLGCPWQGARRSRGASHFPRRAPRRFRAGWEFYQSRRQ